MANDKKKNVFIYAAIAVVVVVAVVVGIIFVTKDKGGSGDPGNGGDGGSTSKQDEYKNIDFTVKSGEYETMEELAKDIQNGEATGKVVRIDGYVSHPLSSYSIVVPNADGTKKIGTQFVIEGDAEYPADGEHIILVGKVVEISPAYYLIRTIPEMISVQED